MKSLEKFISGTLLYLKILLPGLILLSAMGSAGAQQITSAQKLIDKAWLAQGTKKIKLTFKLTQECIRLYQKRADKEEASLSSLPPISKK